MYFNVSSSLSALSNLIKDIEILHNKYKKKQGLPGKTDSQFGNLYPRLKEFVMCKKYDFIVLSISDLAKIKIRIICKIR